MTRGPTGIGCEDKPRDVSTRSTGPQIGDIIQEYHIHRRLMDSQDNVERRRLIEATTGMWADARQELIDFGLRVGDGSHCMEKGYPESLLLAGQPGLNPKDIFGVVAGRYKFGSLYCSGMAYLGMNQAPKGYATVVMTCQAKPGRDFSRLGKEPTHSRQ